MGFRRSLRTSTPRARRRSPSCPSTARRRSRRTRRLATTSAPDPSRSWLPRAPCERAKRRRPSFGSAVFVFPAQRRGFRARGLRSRASHNLTRPRRQPCSHCSPSSRPRGHRTKLLSLISASCFTHRLETSVRCRQQAEPLDRYAPAGAKARLVPFGMKGRLMGRISLVPYRQATVVWNLCAIDLPIAQTTLPCEIPRAV